MNYNQIKAIKYILGGVILIGLLFTVLNFNNNNGDPLVNLVFAKSFKNGFFYYGNEGPKSGSTSPLMVLITAPFYLLKVSSPIIYIKIFYIIIFLLTGYLFYLLGRKLFTHPLAPLILSALFLGNIWFGYLTATLYDSILLFLVLICFYHIFIDCYSCIKEKEQLSYGTGIILGIIGSLALLARPDSGIALLVGYGWLLLELWKNNKRGENYNNLCVILSSFLVCFILGGGFYFLLGIKTGQFIPTSVLARATLKSNSFSQSILKILTSHFYVYYLYFGYLCLSFLAFIFYIKHRNDYFRNAELIKLLFLTAILYFPIFLYSSETRYVSAAFPAMIILSVYSIVQIFEWFRAQKRIPLLVALLFILFSVYSMYSYKIFTRISFYPEDIIIEKTLCNYLNPIVQPSEKVAAYEVQIQYCLNSQIISLDGIVGGEILPYFYAYSDLSDFFKKYRPNYLILSDYVVYREEYYGTILETLFKSDNDAKLGDELTIKGIKFTKMLQNEEQKMPGMRMWDSVYKINYEL